MTHVDALSVQKALTESLLTFRKNVNGITPHRIKSYNEFLFEQRVAKNERIYGIGLAYFQKEYQVLILASNPSAIDQDFLANMYRQKAEDFVIQKSSEIRPLLSPGVSIGHYQISAGTLGAFVKVQNEEGVFILSNNHVLANLNQANANDPILSPGKFDGSKNPENVIAWLFDFAPINEFGNNQIDAAIAKLIPEINFETQYANFGEIRSTTPAYIDQTVAKIGRTTALTQGKVTGISMNIVINYGSEENPQNVTFENQIQIKSSVPNLPFSKLGDSGSLVFQSDNSKAIGLLFSGSGEFTYANPIDSVLSRFNLTLL